MKLLTTLAIVIAAQAVASSGSAGQSVQRWLCMFDRRASEEMLTDGQRLQFEIAWETASNSATLIGNLGTASLSVLQGGAGVTFSEPIATGAIHSTTITRDGTAVHSRNTIMSGKLVPSQYYGRCIQPRGD